MSDSLKTFGDTAKALAKNPLGIIALFIVLVYGLASLVTGFGNSLQPGERLPLVYFLVFFPVLVLGVFGWLVSRHAGKLYGPADYKNEENYIKMQSAAAAYLGAAVARRPVGESEAAETDFSHIADAVRRGSPSEHAAAQVRKGTILWVDDRPENNVYERKAFEALGLSFSLALSTNEALELLRHNKFSTVISDMGRREGPREGYVLLDTIRKQGDTTPFFIYAGSNLPEHKREALQHRAQGSTNSPEELFVLVMKAVIGG